MYVLCWVYKTERILNNYMINQKLVVAPRTSGMKNDNTSGINLRDDDVGLGIVPGDVGVGVVTAVSVEVVDVGVEGGIDPGGEGGGVAVTGKREPTVPGLVGRLGEGTDPLSDEDGVAVLTGDAESTVLGLGED
jgi:hypothetical protein